MPLLAAVGPHSALTSPNVYYLQADDANAADAAEDAAVGIDPEVAAAAAPAAAAAAPQDEEEEFSEDDEPNVGQWSPPPLDPKHVAGRDVIPEAEDEALLNLLRKQVRFCSHPTWLLHGQDWAN